MTLNITLLERLRTYWENILTHFEDGTKKESLKQLLLLLDSDYTTFRNLPQKERKLKIRYEICYCRVSSKKQFNDLDTQITFMQKQFPNCTIVSDIGSGINWKRKGFISILEQSMQGNIKKIIIAHRDRLCRFAFEFVEWLFNKYGVELMVLNKEDKNTTKNELAEDLLSIIHIFSCRENGKRRYSRKN